MTDFEFISIVSPQIIWVTILSLMVLTNIKNKIQFMSDLTFSS